MGLTWSSILLDLSTSGEGQTCGCSRSVKLINVSPVHWKLYFWKIDMADAPSRRMSIPLLLNPRMTQRVAGLLFSPLCVCVGMITKMEGHRGQVCGELMGGEIH